MLNANGVRELVYLVKIDGIEPILGSDNCEAAVVNGWRVMVKKNVFKPNDLAIYFEIDSRVPEIAPFAFLANKHYRIKTQKYTFGGANPDGFFSQGLVMSPADFGYSISDDDTIVINGAPHCVNDESKFLTKELGVVYAEADDNRRKSNPDKYKSMCDRNKSLFKKQPFKWLMTKKWGRKLLFFFFGKKNDKKNEWPVGKFPGVSKTDQERVENMPWVLGTKTSYIRTQKCDGSSATYILERKPFGRFEFYVCSRNVRMMNSKQRSFHNNDGEDNVYWEMAKKYDIYNKLKMWLNVNKTASFVCWQGEICGPAIQKNPHGLKENHFFAFHWTDSINGRRDIIDAEVDWFSLDIEIVPIVDIVQLEDTMEAFKLTADGYYDASVCEGQTDRPREGFVYYSCDDPRFSFKNVSRQYLLR